MPQSTLKAALLDRLHEQADARETRWIAAQEAAQRVAVQVAAVTEEYAFCRDEDNCFSLADGTAVQCAMKLTHKETGRTVSVVCKLIDGDFFWFIQDMTAAPYAAAVYIAAVQCRIEQNRRAVNG